MNRSLTAILALALLPCSSAFAQEGPGSLAKRPPSAAASSRAITLDVAVTDKSGAPIRGLQANDFTLLDDKHPQPITSFYVVTSHPPSPSDPPVQVVLLVDNVNIGQQTVAFERNQIRQYLLQNGGELPHPVSLIVFTDYGTQVQRTPSQDGKALATEYDQYQTGLRSINRSQGFYGAAERFDLSLKTLTSIIAYEKQQPGRKLLIWISPGWPLLTGPAVELTTKQEEQIFRSIVNYSTSLRDARITLYNVDPLGLADAATTRITYYQEFLKGVTSPSRVDAADLSLQVLSVQSGGAVYNSTNDLATSIAKCVSDAASYYVLTFDAAPTDRPDEYHSLQVKVEQHGAIVRTRTGYYAQP
ncbi:MAG TPA: VWA domain-containing protein [Candidatus Acidoferrum sp.]|nr:VWA domain-containing protein [Candidatus Acidoferrum sp.]